jgi:3',5'-cyclic AMP phosphodiesterase CpdA
VVVVDDSVVIAQMSDTHIGEPGYRCAGVVDTAALLEQAVEHVNRLDPDIVLVTGDLVDSGGVGEYAHLRSLLARLDAPVHLLPGNHDDREAMRSAFPRFQRVVEAGPVLLILLDDVIPGSPCGRLGDEQLAWLDLTLAADPRRPTVVALHHPPFLTGIAHMDAMGLEDAAAFGQVIERHPHVERVVCGHLHRPIVTRWCGTLALTAPSVAHQVALDLGPDGPARFVFEPPAVLLHRWSDGGLVTHVSYVGAYDGPYRFDGQRDDRP